MPAWPIVALLGCGAPISNAPFLEEAQFVGVLPTSERFAAPSQVLASPGGDPVLEAAKMASEWYASIVDLPTLVGDQLQAVGPSVREEHLREWGPTKLAIRRTDRDLGLSSDDLVLYVRAEVERTVRGGGDLELIVDVGPTRGGPWARVAEGAWDGEGQGFLEWDLAGTAAALDHPVSEPLGRIVASFDDLGFLGTQRAVEVEYAVDEGNVASFIAGGEVLLSFGSLLEVTDDGAAWPGYATVVHQRDAGGYASGAVFRDALELGFVRCWDPRGETTHARGDPGVAAAGDRDACIEGAP